MIENSKNLLTPDDKKIIEWVGKLKFGEEYRQLPSQDLDWKVAQYFIKPGNKNSLTPIEAAALLWHYLIIYESTLNLIDNLLLKHLNGNGELKNKYKWYIKIPRTGGNHPLTRQVNQIICKLIGKLNERENEGIFNNREGPANLRNKIAHGQIHYDCSKQTKKFIVADKEYSPEEFINIATRLGQFLQKLGEEVYGSEKLEAEKNRLRNK